MFDSTEDPNPPPTAEESYATAASASNLRVEADRRTPADMVIAAGMNQHRMGLALMRLMTEWDASAKPKPMEPKKVEELAASLAVEPSTMRVKVPMTPEQIAQTVAELAIDPAKLKGMVWTAVVTVPNPHQGLVRVESRGKTSYRVPLTVAKDLAADWHSHELGLLLQRMKSLPLVREGLVFEAGDQGWEDPEHIVAAVLQWWLHKTCLVCHGSKFKVVAGTGRTGSKACSKCKGSGERKPPHGWQGRKLLTFINVCRIAAIHGLQGKFRHQKP
jgi:hypothetical protein